MCENRGTTGAQKRKANDERGSEKRTSKKEKSKRNYSKALRKASIAATKASKYGWPTAPRTIQSENESEAETRAQEEVIDFYSQACAAACAVCSEYINNTYPEDSEMIKAQKLQEIEDDDSSKDTTTTEETNTAGSMGPKDTNYQRRV